MRLAASGNTAVRLGRFFGTSPEFWMNLQARCEVLMAERVGCSRAFSLPGAPVLKDF
jgi:plasmid maintenance system antidote protein VapI